MADPFGRVGWVPAAIQGPRVAEHGTRTRYCKDGCRCEPCTAANAVYSMEWRLRRKLTPPAPPEAVPVERPKRCCKCRLVRAPEHFRERRLGYRKRNGLPFRQAACKACVRVYQQRYRRKPEAQELDRARQRARYHADAAYRAAKAEQKRRYRERLKADRKFDQDVAA